ncbi:uncharacterized [Tachysurus ichikawai]
MKLNMRFIPSSKNSRLPAARAKDNAVAIHRSGLHLMERHYSPDLITESYCLKTLARSIKHQLRKTHGISRGSPPAIA